MAESRRLWLVAIFLFVIGDALTLQTRGALLASFRSSFGVSEGVLGLVAPAGTTGFVLAVLVTGLVAGRINIKRWLWMGIAGTVVAHILMSAAPTYWLFLLFLTMQGTATGTFRGLDRPILSHLFPSQRGRMFVFHSLAWAIGAVCGPLLVNQVLAVTDWRITYAALALFFIPIAAFAWRLELPATVSNERELSAGDLSNLLRRPSIVGMTIAMSLVGGMEGIVSTWLPYYATEFVSREASNVLLSVFLLAYVPGRASCSWLVSRFDALNLGILLSVCTLPAFYLLFGGSIEVPLYARAFVAGFVFSGLFPLISTFGVDAAPEYSGPLSAVATASAYAGVSVGPVIIGLLAEQFGIVATMPFVVVLAAALLISLVATRIAIH